MLFVPLRGLVLMVSRLRRAWGVGVAAAERGHDAGGGLELVAPDASSVVGEQMDRDRRDVRDRADVVDVVGRRQQRVALAAAEFLAPGDLQIRSRRIAAIVETTVDRLVLPSAIDPDQSPRQVIVHRRRRAGRHDEREQAQRLVLGTVERVLPDAAAHLAGLVRRRRSSRGASRRLSAARRMPAAARRRAARRHRSQR